MALTVGSRLGHYDVTSLLGEGGMGQVWQATDTQLNREVALKILPDAFAADPDRLARFKREAQILASLNHPNIAAIYGIEEAEPSTTEGMSSGQEVRALVLELVEGPTLADRISKGTIPLDQALPIAKQMAAALEAAHEAAVIHRDLKPANIKVREDGTVKVLDFGLAKALDPIPTGDPSQSPTLTAAATQMGVIMGTAAYMSPEQASGKPVDKRADIWSFGVVLFEMLTGTRAFTGETVSHVLAAVLNTEPDWGELPPKIPDALTRVLRRCLAKDPGRRQRDAGDIRLELEAALQEDAAPSQSKASGSRRVAGLVPWVVTAVLGVVVLGLLFRDVAPSATPPRTRRFALDLPWQNMPNWGDFQVKISPRGTHLAYPGSDENRTTIRLRSLDSLEAVTLVSPSADPWNLAFSPDGERIAFFTGLRLQTVSIHGGQPEPLSEIPHLPESLNWGGDGAILVGGRSLMRVPTSGGEAELVATGQEDEVYVYLSPFHLPDGNHALVSIARPTSASSRPAQASNGRLAVVDLGTGTVRELSFQGVEPIYSPTGHVLFRQGGELFAFRFDLDSLEAQGQAVSIAGGVAYGPSLSDDGTLVYVAARAEGSARLVWVDREGTATPIPGERRDYTHIDLSADGAWALLNIGPDIYASDLSLGSRRLVSRARAGPARFPIWHPDGQLATFAEGFEVVARMADGSGEEERLLQVREVPTSWSPDGAYLAFCDDQSDVWMLPREGDDPQPFLTGPANERSARFSPDGSVVAYVSDESGEFQVYLTPFPGPGSKIPVSIDGGLSPIWSSDGTELYLRQGSKVMSVQVTLTPEVGVSPPVLLFDGPFTLDLSGHQRYDVAPDGRFLMVENSEDFRVVVVEGFFEELKRLVPID